MPIVCFCCSQEDHQAGMCSAQMPQMVLVTLTPLKLKKPPKKGKEKLWAVTQIVENSPPENGEDGTPAKEEPLMVLYNSEREGEDNLMVSGPVNHFEVKVSIKAPHSGTKGVVKAFIDSGSSHCLISQTMVQKLGLQVRKLKKSMKFEHGLLIGGRAGLT